MPGNYLQTSDLAAALVGGNEALRLMPQHDRSELVCLRCQMSLHNTTEALTPAFLRGKP